MAGSYLEKIDAPNVGLWDQRKVLDFVQKNTNLVNGDHN